MQSILKKWFSPSQEDLPLEFNPEEASWIEIRSYILNQDRWLLADWMGLVVQQDWKIPQPFMDFAKRKVQDPYGFEFWTPYASKGHLRELRSKGEEISEEQERDLMSPILMKTDGRFMDVIRRASKWEDLITWKSDVEFDGLRLSKVVYDLYEWKKNKLYAEAN